MTVEDVALSVGEKTVTGRLNRPGEDPDRGVLVLPGAGHGPYGDVFDDLAAAIADSGALCLRIRSWEDPEAIDGMTLGEVQEDVEAAVDRLHGEGCADVSLVAKSFGGAVALTHVPDAVDRLVLWAPAIRYEDDPEMDLTGDLPFEDVEFLAIGPGALGEIDAPTLILHGDEDNIPLENSRDIAGALPRCDLDVIEGEDHSFLSVADGARAVDRTIEFLER